MSARILVISAMSKYFLNIYEAFQRHLAVEGFTEMDEHTYQFFLG